MEFAVHVRKGLCAFGSKLLGKNSCCRIFFKFLVGCVWVITYVLLSFALAGSIGLVYRFLTRTHTHTHVCVQRKGGINLFYWL
jgi:hypothetical protein